MGIIIRVYELSEQEGLSFLPRGLVTQAETIQLVERHFTPGYFTLSVPTQARHAGELQVGRAVLVDGAFWGIIDEIGFSAELSGDRMTVSGRELKGLVGDRITLPPGEAALVGAQGYDAAQGSTETVMKHFVAVNMGLQAAQERRIPGLEIAPDQGRGLAEDRFLSRHDPLDDVLGELGQAGALGYELRPDPEGHKIVFDVVAGEDHTGGQSDRVRVVFDVGRKTALAQSYAYSRSEERNVFYTTMGGAEFADEALTVTYLREGETLPKGLWRRETHLELSADTPTAGEEYNELKRQALVEAENFREAQSMTCEITPGGRYQYRRDYRVGDLVTVRNQRWGVSMDARLMEMESQYSAGGLTLTATFGKAPLNVFGRLQRQIKKGS